MRIWGILGIILAIAGIFWAIERAGYSRGHAAALADVAAAQTELEGRLDARTTALRGALGQLREARTVLAEIKGRVEYEAIQAPGAGAVALPAGSVRRIRSRWQD